MGIKSYNNFDKLFWRVTHECLYKHCLLMVGPSKREPLVERPRCANVIDKKKIEPK